MTGDVAGVNYIALPTKDVEKSRVFYCDILGFKEYTITESGDATFLHHDSANVTIKLVDGESGGDSEICFGCSCIEGLEEKLKSSGVLFQKEKMGGDNVVHLKFVDPADNAIRLSNTLSAFSNKGLTCGDFVGGDSSCEFPLRRGARLQMAESGNPIKRLAVLTSGGDSQGMNAAIRAITRSAMYQGCEVYAIWEGYQGLVNGGDLIKKLGWDDVSGYSQMGGTMIGTARCKEMMTRAGRLRGALTLVSRGIDGLAVIGGDGSLTGANTFRLEWPSLLEELAKQGKITEEQRKEHAHLNVVGMVGSIDNDMCGTDMTIGCDSALHRIVEAVDAISNTAASHQRAFVVEVMGRNCGWLALMATLATGADWCLIPEKPPTPGKWEDDMCAHLSKSKGTGKRRIIVIVAEGAVDSTGAGISSSYVSSVLKDRLQFEARVTILGHVQRGGNATAYDRYLATIQGFEAVDVLLNAKPGDPAYFIGIEGSRLKRVELVQAVSDTQDVVKFIRANDSDRAMQARGTEYVDAWRAYKSVTFETGSPVQTKSLRIAIVHAGAPAGGRNAATRVAVRCALKHGHRVFGVHEGFFGFIRGDVKEYFWNDVDGWSMEGASRLGTNRSRPINDLGMLAFQMQKFEIEALLVIGGFEGFQALNEMRTNRKNYPAFRIPMVCVPATISNNVPGTEFSLGSDTALNTILHACDLIRQSACSSRRRAFVVECMGGHCGYLATMAALAGGAINVYTPEEGITLQMLYKDVNHLIQRFRENPSAGRVVLLNERASKMYSAEVISAMLQEEGSRNNLFDCKYAHLGHVQQGGAPSPLDRIFAGRFASMAIDFFETMSELGAEEESCVIIGTLDRTLKFTAIEQLVEETDFELRRPRKQWWTHLLPLCKILSRYSEEQVSRHYSLTNHGDVKHALVRRLSFYRGGD
eukprot:Rmarinus@m.23905